MPTVIHTLTSPHIDECPQCQAAWDKRNRGISRRRFSIMAIGGLFAAMVKIETPKLTFANGSEILVGHVVNIWDGVYYGNDPFNRLRPGMIVDVFDIHGYVRTAAVKETA